MKKSVINDIVKEYLKIFPTETEKLQPLKTFLKTNSCKTIADWNNAQGHLTAGAFLYCKSTKKFLLLYHKDLKIFTYPGGHCENTDKYPIQRAQIELKEETDVHNYCLVDSLPNHIPFDIDIHQIEYNARVNMPAHQHFDFRYLFVVEKPFKISVDASELSSYKWVTINEFKKDKNFGHVAQKILNLIN